jgi:uncharacterized protein
MRQFLYVLRLVRRLHSEANWTEADRDAVQEHFLRLRCATEAGKVILAGRTEESLAETFGLVVFEATDMQAALEFMNLDPTVVANVITAELHPYSVALLRTHGKGQRDAEGSVFGP